MFRKKGEKRVATAAKSEQVDFVKEIILEPERARPLHLQFSTVILVMF
jgi:hypothetical protein